MSETISIDLSPVLNAINRVQSNVAHVSGQVAAVGEYVGQVDQRLKQLEQDFVKMMEEQRKSAAFQRAITEIIRVRQELEQKYGNQKKVRDNLLGILTAHDLALVKGTTITQCTEELMLDTPNYWLSPCLIAIAAWLNNEQSLAERAITEALRRNKEKASLLFALVCSRSERTEKCFEWLQVYFSMLKANAMKSSIVTFLSAYYNGLFGEDKNKMCTEQIASWMKQLGADKDEFHARQKEYWKDFFNVQCGGKAQKIIRDSGDYQALASMSPDFQNMDNFIVRIEAVEGEGGAKTQLNQIATAPISRKQLQKKIDERLWALVNEYEEFKMTPDEQSEAELRVEERRYTLVKEAKGDEVWAENRLRKERNALRDEPIELDRRLSETLVSDAKDGAERKAALMLMRYYIEEAYAEYITENKDAYPQEINLKYRDDVQVLGANSWIYKNANNNINWSGVTENAENRDELKESVAKFYDNKKEEELAKVKVPGWSWALLVIPGLIASSKAKKAKADMEDKYAARKAAALSQLDKALAGREAANQLVADFCGKENWDQIDIKIDTKAEEINLEELGIAPDADDLALAGFGVEESDIKLPDDTKGFAKEFTKDWCIAPPKDWKAI